VACSSCDVWVELLWLTQRVERLTGCISALQILHIHRTRSLLRKNLSEVQAIHAVHGAQTQILQSSIQSIWINVRQATGQGSAKIHACILLLRIDSDQVLMVQEVLLSQTTELPCQNALISSKLHSMMLLWHQKLWHRRLRLLGGCRRRRLRGGPTTIVALFLLLLRWHHLVHDGRCYLRLKLIARDVLTGVLILILIQVWLLLIVFGPTTLILPCLVGVLRLRLSSAISCLAAAPVRSDLVIVLAGSSLSTTRRWVVPIVLIVIRLLLLLLLIAGVHTWI